MKWFGGNASTRQTGPLPTDNRSIGDLGEGGGDGVGGGQGTSEGEHYPEGGQGFTNNDNGEDDEDLAGVAEKNEGIKEHADGDEKQGAEGVLQGLQAEAGAVVEIGLMEDEAGKKGAEGKGDAEEFGGTEGDAEGEGEDGEGE